MNFESLPYFIPSIPYQSVTKRYSLCGSDNVEVFSPCSLSTHTSAFSRGKDSEKTVRRTGSSVKSRNSFMRSGYSDDEEAQHEQDLSQGFRELGNDEEYSNCSSG